MILGLIALAAGASPQPAPRRRAAPASLRQPRSEKPARTGPNAFFSPTEVASHGSVRIGGRAIPYRAVAGTIVVHAKDWSDTDWLEARAAGEEADDPKPEASMFYVAYFRDGVPAAGRPITFAVQRRAWLVEHLAAHGRVRADAGRDPRSRPHVRALSAGPQRQEPARRQRPRVHRRAGRGLQPDCGQGQGQGLLRGRPGHRRLRPVHHRTSCRNTAASARPNMSWAKAMGRCAARASRWRCSSATSTSTA